MSLRKISIEGMVFHAPIGYYTKEQKIKNQIIIDIHLFVDYQETKKSLEKTINYEDIYTMVKEEVSRPAFLLEDVIDQIAERLKEFRNDYEPNLNFVKAELSITKNNPALGGLVERVTITDKVKFHK